MNKNKWQIFLVAFGVEIVFNLIMAGIVFFLSRHGFKSTTEWFGVAWFYLFCMPGFITYCLLDQRVTYKKVKNFEFNVKSK